MNMRLSLILSMALVFVLFACNKWKQPTDVNFYVDIDKAPGMNGQLTFTGGVFVIESFDFEGERKQGDDVYFSKDFADGLSIPFDGAQVVAALDFVIPQGEYERIDIGMRTYDDNNTISILLEGNYTYTGGGTIPFRFEFEDSEQFKIRAENKNGGNIVLTEDATSAAKILLDPGYWFSIVPISLFENADVDSVSGTDTIVIDKSNNDDIYDLVVDRLKETAMIVFNY